jgi:D-amino-acid oxidase
VIAQHTAPDLSDTQILRFVCGIRPCRTGGLRLEAERVVGKHIVHNYGHGGCGVTLSLGCAEAVLEDVRAQLGPDQGAVAVLGGGVTGLASALTLLRAGYKVTIYAEQFAGDTTSNVAGALWLPTGIDFPEPGSDRERFNCLVRASHRCIRGLDGEKWGVRELPVFEPDFAEYHPEYFESGAIAEPKPWSGSDGIIPGIAGGRVFRTYFIDTPTFMQQLYEEAVRLGGKVITRSFVSLGDIAEMSEGTIVNCLAMGSKALFGDELIFPARGLLVHMKPQRLGYVYHDGYRYMFPRENALILGGTYEPGVNEPPADDEPFYEILERHRARFA